MTVNAQKLRELREKFTAEIDREEDRLVQERKFLEAVLKKSLGGAEAKDLANKKVAAVEAVSTLLGLQ